uniref:Putative FAD/NAD(P)-binding domain-containing protein n=1 Tax=Helianthus annuus TaxID=4232 RepID=A0A251V2Z7_HELAN
MASFVIFAYNNYTAIDSLLIFLYVDNVLHTYRYEFHILFLKTHGILTIEDKCVSPTYGNVFPPQLAPRLSFVGLFHMSKWITRALSGKVSLPSETEMLHNVEQVYREMEEKGIPKSYTHSLNFQVNLLISHIYNLLISQVNFKMSILWYHDYIQYSFLSYQMDYMDWLSDQLGITRPPQKLKDFYARFIERFLYDHEGFRETFKEDLLICDEM